jgi:hypothetical protein
MRLTLWEVILGTIVWLMVLAAVVTGTHALAKSAEIKPKYKYTVWVGGAAVAAGYDTNAYTINPDGTVSWVNKTGGKDIASAGTWRIEEKAP